MTDEGLAKAARIISDGLSSLGSSIYCAGFIIYFGIMFHGCQFIGK